MITALASRGVGNGPSGAYSRFARNWKLKSQNAPEFAGSAILLGQAARALLQSPIVYGI
jgi:hypothetical protein